MKNKCVRLLTAAVVLLMVVMALSLSGCGKKNDVENGTADGTEQTDYYRLESASRYNIYNIKIYKLDE